MLCTLCSISKRCSKCEESYNCLFDVRKYDINLFSTSLKYVLSPPLSASLYFSTFELNAGKLKSLSHHPTDQRYFITGAVQGRVELWDIRYLETGREALASLPSPRGVLSAFFSPLTGNRILSCTADNTIR